MKLRKFTETSPMDISFANNTSPLIKINKNEVIYFNKVQDKMNALENRVDGDNFVISWCGKWNTDVFEVTEENIICFLNKD